MNALLDDCLNPRRQFFNGRCAILDPFPALIPDQITIFLHIAQHLYRKKRVSSCVMVQIFTESFGQVVGFAVQKSIHKRPAFFLDIASQVDLNIAKGPLEFGLSGKFRGASQGDLTGPVRAQD